jgi:hypothetical protein
MNIKRKTRNDWCDDNKILAYTKFDEKNHNLIHIKNIRNFTYFKDGTHKINHYDKTFDLNKLKQAYYIVQPFAFFKLVAHTFVSFEFEDNNFLSISVEIRKKKNEKKLSFKELYLKGLFNKYELIYVVGDEKDVIKYRTNYLLESINLYPLNTTKQINQTLFLDMIKRVNKLKIKPEYYNPIYNNCTTNIVRHVNKIRDKKINIFSLSILFPGLTGRLAHKLNLIKLPKHIKKSPFKIIQNYFNINSRALKYENYEDFSEKIRLEK